MEFSHLPVMLNEVIDLLNISENGIYVDCTLGGGGHSEAILQRLTTGSLIGIDRDVEAINFAKSRLSCFGDKVRLVHNNFKREVALLPFDIGGILIDLGVSSYQIDNQERGFSYMKDAPLDMRMDANEKITAEYVVNNYSKQELTRIFRDYGEERYSSLIADAIVKARALNRISTTLELVSIIESIPPLRHNHKKDKGGHPAKRCFQALRIEVNCELTELYETVIELARHLKKGGRLVIISFHSLEDRIIKQAFKYLETDCLCDKNALVCTCGKKKEINILTKKPLEASEQEKQTNKRACSAKLRAAEKI